MSAQVFVGIDVSKAQLDIALRPEGRFAASNDDTGFAQVLERQGCAPDAGGVGSHRRVGDPDHRDLGCRCADRKLTCYLRGINRMLRKSPPAAFSVRSLEP